MAKRKGKSGSGEGHFIITQAKRYLENYHILQPNLDKKGKTNKKLKRNPMASKYLTVKGRELKDAGEAAYKENMVKHRERMKQAS